jgi:D-alanine-D-alanine ligase-like ATP-grasp enzyme
MIKPTARQRYAVQAKVDLVRAVGLSHAWRRFREDRRHRRVLVGRRPKVADQMWREAAAEVGADIREIAPTLLEFRLGDAWTRIRGQTTPFADPVSDQIASDKPLAYRILDEAGLPVPASEIVDVATREDGAALMERIGRPCIVKPVSGGGGDGVTGEIRTAEQLRRALVGVGKFHHQALIEHQVDGDSYRVLLLDGEVLDVLRRWKPRLEGDGISTVETLMFREYGRRIDDEGPSGLKQFVVDLDCLFALERSGLTIGSVIPAGQSAAVKTATNYNGPEETETMRGPIPKTLLEPARRAASALGVRLAGVDIVTTDPSLPLAETGGVVLEVNPVPGLTHHYNVSDAANATRIAIPILRALLKA